MTRSFVIALTLVAGSAGAGLGISAVHGSKMASAPTLVTAAAIAPTQSGFIIPDYVPAQPMTQSTLPALPTPLGDGAAPAEVMDAAMWVGAGVSLRPAPRTTEAFEAWQDAQPRRQQAMPLDANVSSQGSGDVPFTLVPVSQPDFVVGVYR